MSHAATVSSLKSLGSTFLWGLFCACSWTWCIGMYLPVIMIERFGWPGFLVFAIPNIVGCAAFGFVVRTADRSRASVVRHGGAMLWFSVAAVAFHMLFIAVLFTELVPIIHMDAAAPLAVAVTVFALGVVLSFLPNRDWVILGVLVYGVSLATLFVIGTSGVRSAMDSTTLNNPDLLYFAPVIAIGFLLCPYLDLTFHRALQVSNSRFTFLVFSIAFAAMLVLTLAVWFPAKKLIPAIAVAHIVAQCVFTVGAHLREIRLSPILPERMTRIFVMMLPLVAAAAVPIGRLIVNGTDVGDSLYLRFLVLYALVFPVYVLLFKEPRSDARLARRTMLGFVAIVLLSLPFFELAFFHNQSWMILIPVTFVCVWIMIRWRTA